MEAFGRCWRGSKTGSFSGCKTWCCQELQSRTGEPKAALEAGISKKVALDEFDHDPGRHWDGKGNQMALFDFTLAIFRLVN